MNMDKILNIIRNLNEEGIPTNNASGGAIAGLPPDEPPVKKKRIGKFMGQKPKYKRAIITLESGNSIDLFSEN